MKLYFYVIANGTRFVEWRAYFYRNLYDKWRPNIGNFVSAMNVVQNYNK